MGSSERKNSSQKGIVVVTDCGYDIEEGEVTVWQNT